jgi:antibiotic biosynthesis monooxygenase (ABM) superfamily enzyme
MLVQDAATGTLITSRAVKAGDEDRFERWADRLLQAAAKAPGYLSGVRLGQTQGLQHLVLQFRAGPDAQAWRDSTDFKRLASEADGFSVGLDQMASGDPVRFELPSDASAAKWKRFVTTWIAVFPVLLTISSLMRWLLGDWPPTLQLVPSSLMLTATLQWIILPRIQRWSRSWLLKDANGNLRTD